jgi:antitoxin (DNA-binding transcriptional repressor) of toxin-antitoxin stability system
MCILRIMQKASATDVARNFGDFLGKVEHGRSIQVLKHGRVVARIVPDCEVMPGRQAADIFRSHKADPAAADAIARELAKLKQDEDDALAH